MKRNRDLDMSAEMGREPIAYDSGSSSRSPTGLGITRDPNDTSATSTFQFNPRLSPEAQHQYPSQKHQQHPSAHDASDLRNPADPTPATTGPLAPYLDAHPPSFFPNTPSDPSHPSFVPPIPSASHSALQVDSHTSPSDSASGTGTTTPSDFDSDPDAYAPGPPMDWPADMPVTQYLGHPPAKPDFAMNAFAHRPNQMEALIQGLAEYDKSMWVREVMHALGTKTVIKLAAPRYSPGSGSGSAPGAGTAKVEEITSTSEEGSGGTSSETKGKDKANAKEEEKEKSEAAKRTFGGAKRKEGDDRILVTSEAITIGRTLKREGKWVPPSAAGKAEWDLAEAARAKALEEEGGPYYPPNGVVDWIETDKEDDQDAASKKKKKKKNKKKKGSKKKSTVEESEDEEEVLSRAEEGGVAGSDVVDVQAGDTNKDESAAAPTTHQTPDPAQTPEVQAEVRKPETHDKSNPPVSTVAPRSPTPPPSSPVTLTPAEVAAAKAETKAEKDRARKIAKKQRSASRKGIEYVPPKPRQPVDVLKAQEALERQDTGSTLAPEDSISETQRKRAAAEEAKAMVAREAEEAESAWKEEEKEKERQRIKLEQEKKDEEEAECREKVQAEEAVKEAAKAEQQREEAVRLKQAQKEKETAEARPAASKTLSSQVPASAKKSQKVPTVPAPVVEPSSVETPNEEVPEIRVKLPVETPKRVSHMQGEFFTTQSPLSTKTPLRPPRADVDHARGTTAEADLHWRQLIQPPVSIRVSPPRRPTSTPPINFMATPASPSIPGPAPPAGEGKSAVPATAGNDIAADGSKSTDAKDMSFGSFPAADELDTTATADTGPSSNEAAATVIIQTVPTQQTDKDSGPQLPTPQTARTPEASPLRPLTKLPVDPLPEIKINSPSAPTARKGEAEDDERIPSPAPTETSAVGSGETGSRLGVSYVGSERPGTPTTFEMTEDGSRSDVRSASPNNQSTWSRSDNSAVGPERGDSGSTYNSDASIGPYDRHIPLSQAWNLYFSDTDKHRLQQRADAMAQMSPGAEHNSSGRASQASSYSSGLHELFESSDIADLFGKWKALRRQVADISGRPIEQPGEAPMKGTMGLGLHCMSDDHNFHFFAKGVKPMWEDPMCKLGGKFSYTGPTEKLDSLFFEIVLILISNVVPTFHPSPAAEIQVVGVAFGRKARGMSRVDIWIGGLARAPVAWTAGVRAFFDQKLKVEGISNLGDYREFFPDKGASGHGVGIVGDKGKREVPRFGKSPSGGMGGTGGFESFGSFGSQSSMTGPLDAQGQGQQQHSAGHVQPGQGPLSPPSRIQGLPSTHSQPNFLPTGTGGMPGSSTPISPPGLSRSNLAPGPLAASGSPIYASGPTYGSYQIQARPMAPPMSGPPVPLMHPHPNQRFSPRQMPQPLPPQGPVSHSHHYQQNHQRQSPPHVEPGPGGHSRGSTGSSGSSKNSKGGFPPMGQGMGMGSGRLGGKARGGRSNVG